MGRAKHMGGKGKGKDGFMDDPSSFAESAPSRTTAYGKGQNKILQQDNEATVSGNRSKTTQSKLASEDDGIMNTTAVSPDHNPRINSASIELPRSSKKTYLKDNNFQLSGGKGKIPSIGGGKHTPTMSATKKPLKKKHRFRPGTVALREIKKL